MLNRIWITIVMTIALLGATVQASTVTWYDYDDDDSTAAPPLGPNVSNNAYENYNFGQHGSRPDVAGPLGGDIGDTPAAWSIWKIEVPVGEKITSFTVSTEARYRYATDQDHPSISRVEWSTSPTEPWTQVYIHEWASDWAWDSRSGTVNLSETVTTAYIRIAVDRIAPYQYYPGGDSPTLYYRTLKVEGQTENIPEPGSMAMLSVASFLIFSKRTNR